MKDSMNNSMEQERQQQQNNKRRDGAERMTGVDKKLNGPNRPST